jgi:uncharacterized DUF497 family protein
MESAQSRQQCSASQNHLPPGATVFRDPQHLVIYDEEHSENEDRWITLGIANVGMLLTVVHTYQQIDDDTALVRIVSARKATDNEISQYQEVNQ